MTNGRSHPYHLAVSTYILRGNGIALYNFFFDEIHEANRIAPDGTPPFAASHMGLFCLPMSHKKDAMLVWVDINKLLISALKATFEIYR